jgi:hypothetical protein
VARGVRPLAVPARQNIDERLCERPSVADRCHEARERVRASHPVDGGDSTLSTSIPAVWI